MFTRQDVFAQWAASIIDIPGRTSGASGSIAGRVVGYSSASDGWDHATIWSSDLSGLTDLNPPGTYTSYVLATDGGSLGGFAYYTSGTDYYPHAFGWAYPSLNPTDFSPVGTVTSKVLAVSGNKQGGYAGATAGNLHAGIWSGTPESFVDLHPAGFVSSQVTAMAGNQQTGYGFTDPAFGSSTMLPLVWSGTASSVAILPVPNINFFGAQANAMTSTQQGGYVQFSGNGTVSHAFLWSGAGNPYVDLHPSGGSKSLVQAMTDYCQAGQVDNHAAVWAGTAATYQDLHSLVVSQIGANYTTSTVYAAAVSGGVTSVYGTAYNSTTHHSVAVIWKAPLASAIADITVQPMDQVASIGDSVTLTVGLGAVNYFPAPTCQWYKGGSPLPGQTGASLSLTNVQIGDSGTYNVKVTNSAGSKDSRLAQVAINLKAQTINFPAISAMSFTTGPVNLTASASSGLTVAYAVLSGPAIVTGSILTLNGLGPVTVRATQTGDGTYAAATPVDVTFNVTKSFAYWQSESFNALELKNAALSGDTAVYGQDGLTNLVKYALGLNPKVNATAGLPSVSYLGGNWTYNYSLAVSISDSSVAVEVSTDLVNWSSAGVTLTHLGTTGNLDNWQATYPADSTPNIYFRLKVTR